MSKGLLIQIGALLCLLLFVVIIKTQKAREIDSFNQRWDENERAHQIEQSAPQHPLAFDLAQRFIEAPWEVDAMAGQSLTLQGNFIMARKAGVSMPNVGNSPSDYVVMLDGIECFTDETGARRAESKRYGVVISGTFVGNGTVSLYPCSVE